MALGELRSSVGRQTYKHSHTNHSLYVFTRVLFELKAENTKGASGGKRVFAQSEEGVRGPPQRLPCLRWVLKADWS